MTVSFRDPIHSKFSSHVPTLMYLCAGLRSCSRFCISNTQFTLSEYRHDGLDRSGPRQVNFHHDKSQQKNMNHLLTSVNSQHKDNQAMITFWSTFECDCKWNHRGALKVLTLYNVQIWIQSVLVNDRNMCPVLAMATCWTSEFKTSIMIDQWTRLTRTCCSGIIKLAVPALAYALIHNDVIYIISDWTHHSRS